MDNKIKKYLEHRTIEPTTQAWDRLDYMLTVAEKPKKRYTIQYILAFAASLISILMMFMSPSSEQIENTLVVTKVDMSGNVEVEKEVHIAENEVVKTKDVIVRNEVYKDAFSRKVPKSEVYVEVQHLTKSNDISITQTTTPEVFTEIEAVKILESEDVVISETTNSKVELNKNTLKIDPETLLASINTVKSEPTKKAVASNVKKNRIDPNTLLEEAENVVAKGFLVRALSSLKETSDEILTSVSNRNHEKQR